VINRVSPAKALEATDAVRQMGPGVNVGNTFDFQQHSTNPANVKGLIDFYFNAGFKHVRLPVTWMDGFDGDTLADVGGNIHIQHPRFLQLVEVIDYAIARGMWVILNTHHEFWLKNSYDGSASYNHRFANLWKQIATFFQDRSQRLIFEVLNEPEGAFGNWSGKISPLNAMALSLTRQINMIGYEAIRGTGGLNKTRIVLLMPNGQGNHTLLDKVYPSKESVPGAGRDPFIAFSVHTYDPWDFWPRWPQSKMAGQRTDCLRY
jgi:endoglucanase